jgi:hypothetical protein
LKDKPNQPFEGDLRTSKGGVILVGAASTIFEDCGHDIIKREPCHFFARDGMVDLVEVSARNII